MDFSERIFDLSARIKELRGHATNEEATKNALILPFFQALGYDTFDPRVVVPEFTSDIGTKKNEKIDYAIMHDGQPVFLVECKTCGCPLDQGKANQLHRYFQNTRTARIGILTDGVAYKFFSDLDQPNIMDEKPFMVFDFSNIEDALIPEIKKLANDRFDVDSTLVAAQDLKYTRQIKTIIAQEFQDPSDALVRFFAGQVFGGMLRANVIEDFRPRIQRAWHHHINDVLNERLSVAMTSNTYMETDLELQNGQEDAGGTESETDGKSKVLTTEEEVEGYLIIKSILRQSVPLEHVTMRDTQSYCGILFDDNNRKPICRLHLNTQQKYLGLIDEEKKETRHPIDSLDDIFKYSDEIRGKAESYLDQ
jgi:hypothetical protein